MDREVTWTEGAFRDLSDAAAYIGQDSRSYAAAFVEEMLEAGASLAILGERGRMVPELGQRDVRERIVKGYRLIYAARKERIVIWGVIHGRRDLRRVLRKRPPP
jgi:plasmid stabilization system protein ParE